jgi:hypothetical protein
MSQELYEENLRYQTILRTISHTITIIIEEARAQRASYIVGLLLHLQEQVRMADPFYSTISQDDMERAVAVLARLRRGDPVNHENTPDDPR